MVRREQRLLVLSFYYPPDLSAGSFRTASLVEALRRERPDLRIDVVTTLPNRYSTFKSEAPAEEARGTLTIRRIPLPPHRSGMRDQARAFVRFWTRAQSSVRRGEYDLVFATSSRLLTASLGARIARRLGVPLYLDIRDIFVDTITDVLRGVTGAVLEPVLSPLERWTVNSAACVNLVSPGFLGYFEPRYPGRRFSVFTNGVDDEFIMPSDEPKSAIDGPVRVLYAGNIGDGQGLSAIVPALARRLTDVTFRIIGDGGRKEELRRALSNAGIRNVELLDPMGRVELIREYRDADVLFLHLNDYDAFKRVLPSKIFEYAALGKPIWAGVSGYAAKFLHDEVRNAAVFTPCNVEGALAAWNELTLGDTPRPEFVARFSRTSIMRQMARDVVRCMGPAGA